MNSAAFKQFCDSSLNAEQKRAVCTSRGTIIVHAGAGSGKTRVITARMVNLMLNEQVVPSAIIALTFTNKAAREMRERMAKFIPDDPLPFVGTFHSYCLVLLKQNRSLLEIPDFTILDDEDQERLVREILGRHVLDKKITARQIMATISSIKNDPEYQVFDETVAQLCREYEQEKKKSRAYDFDDLIGEVLKLFRTQPVFKQRFQSRVRHVLIDEYQDTNKVQHELIKQMTLSGEEKRFSVDSLCIVGDEDQSIYAWRGAHVANILNCSREFADPTVITIEQNYRSAHTILEAANSVIRHNDQRNPKNLWSLKKGGQNRVQIVRCDTGFQEADLIAACARKARVQGHSLAILFRSHYQSRALEETFIRNSLPYTLVGGVRFYNRQEVKDILAYAKLVVNPFDRVAFKRVINVPLRALGDAFVEQFCAQWDLHPEDDLFSFAGRIGAALKSAQRVAFDHFVDILKEIREQGSIQDALSCAIRRTSYFEYLAKNNDPPEARTRAENVRELLNAAHAAQERGVSELSAFLDEVALLQEPEPVKTDTNPTLLMTIHSAKGLEFDIVIIAGLEEGILPSGHTLYNPELVEEERRLLYVAMTRAREYLMIISVQARYLFGRVTDQRLSRFIKELPSTVAAIACAGWKGYQFERYIDEWLQQVLVQAQPERVTKFMSVRPECSEQREERIEGSRTGVQPQTNRAYTGTWREHQRVTHATFGAGTVEQIEKRAGATFLTIRFAQGVKKISAQFVSS